MNTKNELESTDKAKVGETVLNRFVVKEVTAKERLKMISEAAYFLAEHRSFQGCSQELDWLKAEIEIDKLLATDPHLHKSL